MTISGDCPVKSARLPLYNESGDHAGARHCSALAASPMAVNRTWSIGELDIFNEVHRPIAVIAYGVYDTPHR